MCNVYTVQARINWVALSLECSTTTRTLFH